MSEIVDQFFNIDQMAAAWPIMRNGLLTTLLLSCVVVPLGLAGGLGLALAARSRRRWVRIAVHIEIDFFRAIPPLVLLIFIYSGLPFAGLQLSPFASVGLAFLLTTSSYYCEIFRAGIESVARGQAEAARSTGLNGPQAMLYVVLPQAVRTVLPDLISNTIEVVKLTSIASVVALADLLYSADMARSLTYNTSPLVFAAAIYLALLWPLVRLTSRLERRLAT